MKSIRTNPRHEAAEGDERLGTDSVENALRTLTDLRWRLERRGMPYSALRVERAVRSLRVRIAEHHAVGAMDGVLIGDPCPICAREDQESLPL